MTAPRRSRARETVVRAGVVDVFVVRAAGRGWQHLALRRAVDTRCPGTWEAVHGKIESGESPPEAARRELHEETGLECLRLYALTVNPFFLATTGVVELAVAFVAVVDPSAVVVLGEEHDDSAWLSRAAARRRYHWPRERESLDHIAVLFKGGHAGAAEDVLRIFPVWDRLI